MSNIKNNNFQFLKLKTNNDEYWDFFLDNESYDTYSFYNGVMYDGCLRAYIDVSQYDCVDEGTINSLEQYQWEYANSIKHTLYNIGYTGFDNGLLHFRKDRILNKDFIELYKNSKYLIDGDKSLKLHIVTGSTLVYEYPLTVEDFQIKLNGGFYQGFFKTECDKYQVLPSVLEQGDTWAYEFVLKKTEHEKESTKTLNDKYPENKGIFFYIGTRAENKWIYLYDENYVDNCFTLSYDDYIEGGELDVKTYKLNSFLDMSMDDWEDWEDSAIDDYITNNYYSPLLYKPSQFDKIVTIDEINNLHQSIQHCDIPNKLSKCDFFGDDYLSDISEFNGDCLDNYLSDDIDISDFVYETYDSFTIGKYEEYLDTDNKFLLFDRTCNGFNVKNWEDGISVRYIKEKNTFNENLFLLMNRTCTGYNVNTIHELKKQYKKEYNLYGDLYNNALAFRITDDGAIGYRYLIQDCDSDTPYKIKEGYSKNNIIPNDEWCVIHVKIYAQYETMQLRFYVNGNLVFVTDPMPKLNLRALDDVMEKQETVPFNISIGGGTQGLCDVILPNYMIEPYRVYPLEKHFAGTFIGYFKSFKFYDCDIEHMNIVNNFKFEMGNLDLN